MTTKTMNEWAQEICAWGESKGWDMTKCKDGTKPDIRRDFILGKLALVHSEISEAVECVRDDDFAMRIVERLEPAPGLLTAQGETVKPPKPEGMVTELADTVIRIMHLCGAMGLDLDEAVRVKMEFNAGRPFQHGRKA